MFFSETLSFFSFFFINNEARNRREGRKELMSFQSSCREITLELFLLWFPVKSKNRRNPIRGPLATSTAQYTASTVEDSPGLGSEKIFSAQPQK